MILRKNHFEFNGSLYLQIRGTAMGTKCAVALSSLFMGRLEKALLEGFDLKPLIWLRFIDDIFFLWTHGEEALLRFFTYANTHHPTIKFTMDKNLRTINFLDTAVIIDQNSRELYTTLYVKPTDTRDFLHYSSAHPATTKQKGPYGQFLRIRRICTKDTDFNREARALLFAYLKRGYPLNILEEHLQKASGFSQDELLEPKTKIQEDKQVVILDYNPGNPDIMQIIHKYWPLISSSRTLGKIFPSSPLGAFRRQKNLKDLLVASKLRYPPPPPRAPPPNPRNTTCPKITCRYCRIMDKAKTATSSALNTNIKTRYSCTVSCLTPNVVYLIICLKCQSQYIGETQRKVKERIGEHLRFIKNFGNPNVKDTPVSQHFNICCKKPAQLRFQILEVIRANPALESTTKLRKRREKWWVLTLRTLDPLGMNVSI